MRFTNPIMEPGRNVKVTGIIGASVAPLAALIAIVRWPWCLL